ncbi:putative nucleotide-diphospho-sugar transferase [Rhizobium leucaenae]|uniref:putative nucleotide-diphospho-sugar transferase n=1 Tax=Rhizobium leucaenae TaxID=29450 RepID=UPI0007EE5F3A|nr:putative nucleotide-diphospho-sugar transferase [Rhizobium leucaenae]
MFTRIIDLFRTTKARHREILAPFPKNPQPSPSLDAGEVVAFFSVNSFYETEAARMVASAWRLGLSVHTWPFVSAGSWVRNASLKPTFLVRQRENRRGPLLYVDVDAVFHNDPWPILADLDCDIAVYRERGDRLISATILINDTPAAQEILALWKKRCDENPEVWDQVVLQEILDEDKASGSPRYREAQLAATFCWIFDRVENGIPEKIYIEQLQASREISHEHARGKARRGLKRRQDRVRTIERILNEHRGRLRK